MAEEKRTDYLIPAARDSAEEILGWCREAFKEGDNHLRSQRAYKDMTAARDMIAGEEQDDIPPELSKVYTNRLKRQIKEAVAVQSQVNPSWSYQTYDDRYKPQANVLNTLLRAWWSLSFADLRLRTAEQYAAVMGTGYIQPMWRKSRSRYGRGEIDLLVYGPNDVRLVQPPRDYDLQRCYAVIITVETPINLARSLYPTMAAKIHPDRDAATFASGSRAMKMIESVAGSSMVMKMFGAGRKKEKKEAQYPTVDIHYMYVMDNTINGTGHEMQMGKPGSTWGYKVPYLGQEIPTNTLDPDGNLTTRKATEEDCMLYPLRRLVVFCDSALLSDGPSPHWHGKVPLVKFSMDDWPWEMLGYGMARDGHPIQKEINMTLKGVGDLVQRSLRPPLGYDPNKISKANMQKFDPRKPGSRVQMALDLGKAIEPLLPAEMNRIEPTVIEYLNMLFDQMDHQSAVTDMRNLAKAKQIPSDSTIDKILEIAGPVVQDSTRVMELSMHELGEMIKAMFFQHYTTRRKVSMVGDDGLTLNTQEFSPEQLVAADLKPVIEKMVERGYPRFIQMREFMENFQLIVVPNSLHEITQTQYKLMIFQMWRDGRFPIDPWTVAEVFKLKNFGIPPNGTESTVYDRWKVWMADSTEFSAVIQAHAQMKAAMMTMGGMIGAGMPGGAPGGGGGEENGGRESRGNRPGRKPTGQKPPSLEQKGDGRTVISES